MRGGVWTHSGVGFGGWWTEGSITSLGCETLEGDNGFGFLSRLLTLDPQLRIFPLNSNQKSTVSSFARAPLPRRRARAPSSQPRDHPNHYCPGHHCCRPRARETSASSSPSTAGECASSLSFSYSSQWLSCARTEPALKLEVRRFRSLAGSRSEALIDTHYICQHHHDVITLLKRSAPLGCTLPLYTGAKQPFNRGVLQH